MTTVGKFVDKTSLRPASIVHPQPHEVERARRFVASQASGVDDCRELLAMLGLGPTAEEIAALNPEYIEDTVIQADTATEGPA